MPVPTSIETADHGPYSLRQQLEAGCGEVAYSRTTYIASSGKVSTALAAVLAREAGPRA
jgi:hypothetical protein